MSQVYATEPSTTGKVTLQTSYGPLEISLWCKECPSTCKYFLQLCHDGFFDSLKFHRLVPGFLIQTGLRDDVPPPAMNQYRQDIQADQVMERQSYELHSRLKFNHRGQIAMALNVEQLQDQNYTQSEISVLQPQFFITLDEAPYLNSKHVLFGTIQGPTVFNALRIGNVEIDTTTNTPLDMESAPYIQSIQIHQESFDSKNQEVLSFMPTQQLPWKTQSSSETTTRNKKRGMIPTSTTTTAKTHKKKKKRKGKRDANVLSFGDEFMDGGDDNGGGGGSGIQSSHDVIVKNNDKNGASIILSSQVDEQVKQALEGGTDDEPTTTFTKVGKHPISSSDKDLSPSNPPPPPKRSKNEESSATMEAASVSKKSSAMTETKTIEQHDHKSVIPHVVMDDHPDATTNAVVPMDTDISNTETKGAVNNEENSSSVAIATSTAKQKEHPTPPPPSKKKMSAVEAMRAKYKSKTSSSSSSSKKYDPKTREEETMAKLMNFQSKVRTQAAQRKKDGADNVPPQQDNSLASRMARRIETDESATTTTTTPKFQNDGGPSYHGQILDDEEDDDNLNKSSWLATTFSCRRHIDHASKGAGGRLEELHNAGSHKGADGRNANDDYVVIDEQRRNTQNKNGRGVGGGGKSRGRYNSPKQHRGHHSHRQQGRGYRDNNDRERGGGGNRDRHERHRNGDGRTTAPKQSSSRYHR